MDQQEAEVAAAPQVQVLSIDTISDIIKEAVGGVKEYIDDALTNTKHQVLVSAKVQLKFKGNRVQYEFNEKQKEKVEKALAKLKKGDFSSTSQVLEEVVKDLILEIN